MKRLLFVLGCCVCLGGPAAASAQDAREPPASVRSIERFELLANLAYGDATTDFTGVKLDPYGALFGLDFGYTWRFGLRLGLHADYGLGRSESQRYERLLGRDISFTSARAVPLRRAGVSLVLVGVPAVGRSRRALRSAGACPAEPQTDCVRTAG